MFNNYKLYPTKISHKLFIFLMITSFIPIFFLVNIFNVSMKQQLYDYHEKELHYFESHFLSDLNKFQNYFNSIALDYSYWEETYQNTLMENTEWLKVHIVDWLPKHFGFSYVAIVKDTGELMLESKDGFYNEFGDSLYQIDFSKEISDFVNIKNELYIVNTFDIRSEKNSSLTSGQVILLKRIDEAFLKQHLYLNDISTNIYSVNNLVIYNSILDSYFKETPFNEVESFSDGKFIYHFIPLYDIQGDVVAYGILELPANFFYQALNTIRRYQITTYLAVLFFFLLSFYFMKKYLINPINHAKSVIRQIKITKKPIPMNIYYKDEFGDLTRSFNELATEIADYHQELIKLTITDDITELYNSRYFSRIINSKIQEGVPFVLVLLDINFIKSYSNLFSRSDTDIVVKEISNIIKDLYAPLAFRITDANYSIIFNNNDINMATQWVQAFQKSIKLMDFKGKDSIPSDLINASAGIAAFPLEAHSKDTLLKITEIKLKNAKSFTTDKIGNYHSVFQSNSMGEINSYEDAYAITKVLLSVIHSMDEYTLFHSEGVTEHSLAIGRQLLLTPDELEELKYAALLHDIGKLQIGEELLNKTETLSQGEFNKLKMHSIYGVNILCSLPKLKPILPIIKHHHEWYDGKGYPDGLVGETIPLLSRIISVADAYDSMTTKRPYRNYTKSHVEAIEELLRCSGTQFDPEIVRIFISIQKK